MKECCIQHAPEAVLAQVYSDFRDLTGGDAIAAALLWLFEDWCNEAISLTPDLADAGQISVGARSISEFEARLCGLARERAIRRSLKALEAAGYVQSTSNRKTGTTKTYTACISVIQNALNEVGQ
jgi:plasmid replication initiation protein